MESGHSRKRTKSCYRHFAVYKFDDKDQADKMAAKVKALEFTRQLWVSEENSEDPATWAPPAEPTCIYTFLTCGTHFWFFDAQNTTSTPIEILQHNSFINLDWFSLLFMRSWHSTLCA